MSIAPATLKEKHDQEGKLIERKARLVVDGSRQVTGVDVGDVFAPVVQARSVRMLLSIAAAADMCMEQADVSSAFAHGELDDVVYMEILKLGFKAPSDGDYVLRLSRSLYGLR